MPTRAVHPAAIAGAVALALLGAGCGTIGPSAPRRPVAPRPSLPARTRSGLVSVPWTFAGASHDGVLVTYNASGCDGFVFNRVAVRETVATVTIAVYDRYRPLPSRAVCATVLVIRRVTVHLRAPLAGRNLEHAPVAWRSRDEPGSDCSPAISMTRAARLLCVN